MNSIGGYLGLELRSGEAIHGEAIQLNTGRNALEYIVKARKYRKLYLPYFTCDVLFQPLIKLGIELQFYYINDKFEPVDKFSLADDEAFLYTNYFGVKDEFLEAISKTYKNLIIDNSQSYYSTPIAGIDTFYSARKFLGVSDGAHLYTVVKLSEELEIDVSFKRMEHLLKRIDVGAEEGYADFKRNDTSLDNQEIKAMSNLTQAILSGIDYKSVKQQRNDNFNYLHKELNVLNKLKLNPESYSCPMVYPLLTRNGEALKKELIKFKVFVASYWPNVLDMTDINTIENFYTKNLVPLPIDQRYSKSDMDIIVNIVNRFYGA